MTSITEVAIIVITGKNQVPANPLGKNVKTLQSVNRGYPKRTMPYAFAYIDGERFSNHLMRDCQTFLKLQELLDPSEPKHEIKDMQHPDQ
jgi:hypothetical protein